MSNKALLGVLVALVGGVAAIPAGTATAANCPPGTPVGPYCPNGGGTPAGGNTHSCPPGTPVGPYCPNGGGPVGGPPSGGTPPPAGGTPGGGNSQDLGGHPDLLPGGKSNKKGDSLTIGLTCTFATGCPGGTLFLDSPGTFAKAHAAVRGSLASAIYGPLARGQSETVTVPLTPAGKAALKKGKLLASVNAVSRVGTKSLGTITIAKGKQTKSNSKAKKHKTLAKVKPNFTG
jgi:hypothetical protein